MIDQKGRVTIILCDNVMYRVTKSDLDRCFIFLFDLYQFTEDTDDFRGKLRILIRAGKKASNGLLISFTALFEILQSLDTEIDIGKETLLSFKVRCHIVILFAHLGKLDLLIGDLCREFCGLFKDALHIFIELISASFGLVTLGDHDHAIFRKRLDTCILDHHVTGEVGDHLTDLEDLVCQHIDLLSKFGLFSLISGHLFH